MHLPGAGQHHNIISTRYTSKVHTQILQISILYWYVISHRGISTSGALIDTCKSRRQAGRSIYTSFMCSGQPMLCTCIYVFLVYWASGASPPSRTSVTEMFIYIRPSDRLLRRLVQRSLPLAHNAKHSSSRCICIYVDTQ